MIGGESKVMVSFEAQARILAMLAAQRDMQVRFPDGQPLEQGRREWEVGALATPLPAGTRVTPVDAGGVAAEWVDVPPVRDDRVFLLLHGGGYTAGSPRTHRKLAALMSPGFNGRMLLPDYRLAPEFPYPAGVEDALTAYRWLLGQEIAPRNIMVGGDSAGGGLALSMLLRLRAAGEPLPRAAVLLSPWTDLTVSADSYAEFAQLDPSITRKGLLGAARHYLGADGDPRDPIASPVFATLSGLPPMLIQSGGHEVMLDDSRVLAERARAAGVEVIHQIYEGMWHVHQHDAPDVPEAAQAIDDMAAFFHAQFGD